MPSPFPGMDPYLESSLDWQSLHADLVVEICRSLQPQLNPRYVARTELRVVVGPVEAPLHPDVHVHERRGTRSPAGKQSAGGVALLDEIEIPIPDLTVPHRYVIIRTARGQEVVTVIEVLSPTNKLGSGQADYKAKQQELLLSDVNLVEIDLLRSGLHTVVVPQWLAPQSDYRVCVHRARRNAVGLIPFGVRDSLPAIKVPLRPDDPDVTLDLQRVFSTCYDLDAYGMNLDYNQQPVPALSSDDWAWSRELLREKGILPATG